MIDYLKQELKNCYRFRYVTLAFVSSTLKHRYRRSALGFLWTVLAPFLHYIIMGLVFSMVTKSSVPNFFLYYFTGAVFFSAVSSVVNRATVIFIGNEHYLKKIYLPKLIFVGNAIIYEFTNFILTLSTLFLLGNIFGSLSLHWTIVLLPIFFVFLMLFLAGISTMIAIASVYFRDLLNIVPVVMQAVFFATPIFYSIQDLPEQFQKYFVWSPLNPFLTFFRQILLYGEMPAVHTWIFIISSSVLSVILGVLVLRKFENQIVFRL